MEEFKSAVEYLKEAVEKKASDIHLKVGKPVVYRINGKLVGQDTPILKPEDTKKIITQILSKNDLAKLEETLDLDTSYSVNGYGRFRVNCAYQRGSMFAVLRLIETRIRSVEELGLPQSIKDFANEKRGLVLITGPTGSGKSTTLAALIDMINKKYNYHILTIEDPIEYLHVDKESIINQREVGQDTQSFDRALKSALREDPDVILLGEMRDLETIRTAITMAETGHLVFATLHTNSAAATIDRIIDVFPADQQNQIRTQLSSVLEGIVCQSLIPHKNGRERVAVCEVLKMVDAARAKVKSGNHKSLVDDMQTGSSKGMQTFDQALVRAVNEGKVDARIAETYAQKPESFKKMLLRG